jgi:hypothetical protein
MLGLFRVALLVCAVLLTASQGRSADDQMPSSSYFPTAIGTTWHYRVGENHYVVKVTKHEKVGDLMCARLEMIVNKKTVMTEHVGITGGSIVRASFDGKPVKPPIPFFKQPDAKNPNLSWKIDSKIDDQVFKGEFKLGEQKELKVLDKTYPNIVTVTGKDMDVNGAKMNLTYYFAEKVGMVQQVIELAGQKIVILLEKFEPAKEKEKKKE